MIYKVIACIAIFIATWLTGWLLNEQTGGVPPHSPDTETAAYRPFGHPVEPTRFAPREYVKIIVPS